MRPTWLFEVDVFGETAEPLKAEIRRQGMACHVTREDLLRALVRRLVRWPPSGRR